MCRLTFIMLLPFLVSGQPFTEKDIAFLGKKEAGVTITNDLTVSLITAFGNTSNSTVYATAEFTPASNALLVACVCLTPDDTFTVTNTGTTQLTWWRAANITFLGSRGFQAWVTQLAQGVTPFSMTVVVPDNISGQGANMHIVQVTGADQTAAWGTNAIVQSSVDSGGAGSANPTNQFAAPSNGGENTLLFVVGDAINSTTDNAPTLSWTELAETAYDNSLAALSTYYSNNVPATVTTVTNTHGLDNWGTIVLEIKAGTGG